eukprot:SAG22_NODE_11_length_35583_cov_107.128790_24_plen_312_part_00
MKRLLADDDGGGAEPAAAGSGGGPLAKQLPRAPVQHRELLTRILAALASGAELGAVEAVLEEVVRVKHPAIQEHRPPLEMQRDRLRAAELEAARRAWMRRLWRSVLVRQRQVPVGSDASRRRRRHGQHALATTEEDEEAGGGGGELEDLFEEDEDGADYADDDARRLRLLEWKRRQRRLRKKKQPLAPFDQTVRNGLRPTETGRASRQKRRREAKASFTSGNFRLSLPGTAASAAAAAGNPAAGTKVDEYGRREGTYSLPELHRHRLPRPPPSVRRRQHYLVLEFHCLSLLPFHRLSVRFHSPTVRRPHPK